MCRSWPKSTGSELEVLAHLWPSGGRRGWRWRGEGRVDVVHTAANKYHLCSCLILILHTMYTLLRATEGLCLRLDVPMFLYLAIQLVLLTIDQHSCTRYPDCIESCCLQCQPTHTDCCLHRLVLPFNDKTTIRTGVPHCGMVHLQTICTRLTQLTKQRGDNPFEITGETVEIDHDGTIDVVDLFLCLCRRIGHGRQYTGDGIFYTLLGRRFDDLKVVGIGQSFCSIS